MFNKIKSKMLVLNKRIIVLEKKIFGEKKIKKYKDDSSLYKEYYSLLKIKNYFDKWNKYLIDLNSVKLLLNDNELGDLVKEEIIKLENNVNYYLNKLKESIFSLNIKNKNDILNAYIEIYSGTGGNEASLFVLDLFKMYLKYSENNNWKVEIINSNVTECGGYKDIIIKIIGKNVYGKLKFESGGHRVQRVPLTESQGRVHTSTCIVAVMPDIPKSNLPILKNEDIKIETFRSSGAGGQHVNTTDSAIRLRHIPTGIVVECQKERSQHKNKYKALEVLKARIYNLELSKHNDKISLERKKLLGSGLRSYRNRTYNFSKNRVTDHRINLTLYSLNSILNGNLNLLIKPIIKYDDNLKNENYRFIK